jgi:flagellin
MMAQRLPLLTNYRSQQTIFRLSESTRNLDKLYQQASTGNKLNKALDNISGFAIAQTLDFQIKGTDQSIQNIQDTTNMVNVTEGAISALTDNLQRMRELTVQMATDTIGPEGRLTIAQELASLTNDLDRVVNSTSFNGLYLLNGTITGAAAQSVIGINSTAENIVDLANLFVATDTTALGIITGTNAGAFVTAVNDIYDPVASTTQLNTSDRVRLFMSDIDDALLALNRRRANLGAMQNQLSMALSNQELKSINFKDSEARIRNADIGELMSQISLQQVIQQSALNILEQNNKFPERVMQLLQSM